MNSNTNKPIKPVKVVDPSYDRIEAKLRQVLELVESAREQVIELEHYKAQSITRGAIKP